MPQIQNNPQMIQNLPPFYGPGTTTAEFAKITGRPVVETVEDEGASGSGKGKEERGKETVVGGGKKKGKKGRK